MATYKRVTYIPIETITQPTQQNTTRVLDWYAAKYNGAFDRVNQFTSHQIKDTEEGRLDNVSYAEYGTPDLWWVIGLFNGIINPIFEIKTGMYLRIPARTAVEFVLQNKSNDSSKFGFPASSLSGTITVELR